MKTIQTLITTVCILTTPLLFAQTSQWQLADGTEGRAIYDIEFYESDRDTLYAISDHALLMSTDRGASWDSVTSVPAPAAGAVIEIDPFDSKRLLLGYYILSPSGTEILMTEDGGINWESIFLDYGQWPVFPIIENDPGDPHTVYINVTPNTFYRSSDYGHTWDSIPSPDIEGHGYEPGRGQINSLAIAPSDNDIIYAGCFNLNTYNNEIYKSTDRSQTWDQIPFPSINGWSIFIAVHPENPDILYVAVHLGEDQGVYKSNDGGENWAQKNNGIEALAGDNLIHTIVIHPKEPETLYLGVGGSADNGDNPILYRSVDGAESWIPFNAGLLDTNGSVNTLAIDTLNHRMYAGTNRGIYVRDFELNIDDNDVQLPQTFSLEQNYPNPFNAATTIPYTLLEESWVHLTLYDISGRRVKTLIDDTVPAGIYKAELDAENLPSGLYIYRLKIGTEVLMRKAVLMK